MGLPTPSDLTAMFKYTVLTLTLKIPSTAASRWPYDASGWSLPFGTFDDCPDRQR